MKIPADALEPETLQQIIEAFVTAHLAWATQVDLLNLVAVRAETHFYQGLANLTKEFLESELV